MSIKKRNELKNFFINGSIPTQENFCDLIDSLVHKEEDSWFSEDDGVRLYPLGNSSKLLSFFENIGEKTPFMSLKKSFDSDTCALNFVNNSNDSCLYLRVDGFIGVGTVNPDCRLDVRGNSQSYGRRGTFRKGKVLGNGEWHTIIDNLSDCHAFEIIAKINKPGKGMHSIVHAIAVSAFNGKCSEIKETVAYYANSKDKIEFKWGGNDFNYNLNMRTKRNYGENFFIEYYVTNLWW